jgi:iron(II)-dependent oxidoreductase
MCTIASPGASTYPPSTSETIAQLGDARQATLALVSHLDDQDLLEVHSPLMSPLVWDLAHIAAYEDLWLVHRHSERPLLRPDLAALYDAFETPRSVRGDLELLDVDQTHRYMADIRARTIESLADRGVGDGVLCEMVLRHEYQHSETMRQTMAIAGLLPDDEPRLAALEGERRWIEVPAGPFLMGATDEGFAYDNERPRHTAQTAAFSIASHPVSNEEWMRFSEDGGYERREWWSEQGWEWKREHDIARHESIAGSDPLAAVCHVSWFEADAFARAREALLSTEEQWEKAVGSAPTLRGVGMVWEWTSSHFSGYPGFTPYPYREYSEVFFDKDYLVLRGGSWATDPRVASTTFRNWDHPQRRQIFAGLRLVRDAR